MKPMSIAIFVLTSFLFASASMAAIEVRVDAPATVTDLQPLALRVMVKNAGNAPLTIAAPTFLRNVQLDVVAVRTDSDRCSSHRVLDGVSQAGIKQVTIPAGATVAVDATPADASKRAATVGPRWNGRERSMSRCGRRRR